MFHTDIKRVCLWVCVWGGEGGVVGGNSVEESFIGGGGSGRGDGGGIN